MLPAYGRYALLALWYIQVLIIPGFIKMENYPHSARYFNEARDFWWNKDFLQLMATRLCLQDVHSILDAGCGQGHWGLLLLPFLHPDARLVGVEPEEKWRLAARERARQDGFAGRTEFVDGTTEKLPFADSSFDMVTCQTFV